MPYRLPSPPAPERPPAFFARHGASLGALLLCLGALVCSFRLLVPGACIHLNTDGAAVHAKRGGYDLRAGHAVDRDGHGAWAVWIVHVETSREESRVVLPCGWNGRGEVAWDTGGRAWFYCADTQHYIYWERADTRTWRMHYLGSPLHPQETFRTPPEALHGH